MNQTMDYRELMKNQNEMGIVDDFGDELVLPVPEVSKSGSTQSVDPSSRA